MSTNLYPWESRPSEPFEVTKQLTSQLVDAVGVDGVVVAVFASDATRDLVFASDIVTEELDNMQFTLGEGPCLDAYRFDGPESHDDMAGGEARARWPFFASEALAAGGGECVRVPPCDQHAQSTALSIGCLLVVLRDGGKWFLQSCCTRGCSGWFVRLSVPVDETSTGAGQSQPRRAGMAGLRVLSEILLGSP